MAASHPSLHRVVFPQHRIGLCRNHRLVRHPLYRPLPPQPLRLRRGCHALGASCSGLRNASRHRQLPALQACSMSNKMRAIVQERYGSADVLELRDIDKPEMEDDEVLVRVHAAGVDRGVWHLMTGLPYFLRLIIPDLGRKAPKNPVRGSDVAGVVEAVGNDVSRFKLGDEVFGIGMGSYAEYTRVPEDKLAPKPTNLTFDKSAVVPISGLTALQAVRDSGKVQPGQKVLIIGASGGVGTFAVQIARSFGAEVTGVCSTTKADLVRSL